MTFIWHDLGMRDREASELVTKEIIEELNDLRLRTGIGASALLRGQRSHMPSGLGSCTITRWLNGKTKTARKDHIDFVLTLWRSKLDNDHKRIELTPAHKEKLRSFVIVAALVQQSYLSS
ncbi:hypothetical protein AB835_13960 [Candidatus Endobugula sertula]|uniref:Uncharacterized protein n=1 Tax=Candidatus Endobugula sertula TaxID=62101 RepID=A0A1D2QLN7_9GAMM|nr:hypothetical protein AB835_13960 [Candidatus Endobugula sertula]